MSLLPPTPHPNPRLPKPQNLTITLCPKGLAKAQDTLSADSCQSLLAAEHIAVQHPEVAELLVARPMVVHWLLQRQQVRRSRGGGGGGAEGRWGGGEVGGLWDLVGQMQQQQQQVDMHDWSRRGLLACRHTRTNAHLSEQPTTPQAQPAFDAALQNAKRAQQLVELLQQTCHMLEAKLAAERDDAPPPRTAAPPWRATASPPPPPPLRPAANGESSSSAAASLDLLRQQMARLEQLTGDELAAGGSSSAAGGGMMQWDQQRRGDSAGSGQEAGSVSDPNGDYDYDAPNDGAWTVADTDDAWTVADTDADAQW